jgi:hypothetical protein
LGREVAEEKLLDIVGLLFLFGLDVKFIEEGPIAYKCVVRKPYVAKSHLHFYNVKNELNLPKTLGGLPEEH